MTLKRAGFRVLGTIDCDELAVETYSRNHPDVTVWAADIREVSVAEVLRTLSLKPGQLDLIAGR